MSQDQKKQYNRDLVGLRECMWDVMEQARKKDITTDRLALAIKAGETILNTHKLQLDGAKLYRELTELEKSGIPVPTPVPASIQGSAEVQKVLPEAPGGDPGQEEAAAAGRAGEGPGAEAQGQ